VRPPIERRVFFATAPGLAAASSRRSSPVWPGSTAHRRLSRISAVLVGGGSSLQYAWAEALCCLCAWYVRTPAETQSWTSSWTGSWTGTHNRAVDQQGRQRDVWAWGASCIGAVRRWPAMARRKAGPAKLSMRHHGKMRMGDWRKPIAGGFPGGRGGACRGDAPRVASRASTAALRPSQAQRSSSSSPPRAHPARPPARPHARTSARPHVVSAVAVALVASVRPRNPLRTTREAGMCMFVSGHC